ncbi:hypothetical protein BH10ACI1_BH10ACI1_15860 [soil metagenome]
MSNQFCEICGQRISGERRIEVRFSPFSGTCSVKCEQWLKSQIAVCANEKLLMINQNAGNQFGAETLSNARLELQKRGIQQPPNTSFSNAGELKTCFECGNKTASLKNYRVMQVFVFLIIFMVARGIDYEACPSCMRKKIATCAAIQIVTAHIVFPIILIFHIVQFCRTFTSGHSR